mgnify:CR=1 FL=1
MKFLDHKKIGLKLQDPWFCQCPYNVQERQSSQVLDLGFSRNHVINSCIQDFAMYWVSLLSCLLSRLIMQTFHRKHIFLSFIGNIFNFQVFSYMKQIQCWPTTSWIACFGQMLTSLAVWYSVPFWWNMAVFLQFSTF